MGEWVIIIFGLDYLESGFTSSDMRFSASMAKKKRQERISNVAMRVNSYLTIVD